MAAVIPKNSVARGALDADRALAALRALRLDYRPNLTAVDGAWIATCPSCRAARALRLREVVERDDDHRNPPVSVGGARRCTEPATLAALLAMDPSLLATREERDRWRSLACWAIDSYRRAVAA